MNCRRASWASLTSVLLLLATDASAAAPGAWHWSPPKTGSPVAQYVVDVRDVWGTRLLLTSTPDTTVVLPDWTAHVAVRLRVYAVDDAWRAGPYSPWSDLWIPREWSGLWATMGTKARYSALTMTVVGIQALQAEWPDSLR